MDEHEQETRSRMVTAFLRSQQSRNVRDREGYVAILDCLNALRPYQGIPWSHDDIADVVRTSIRTNDTCRFHAKYSGVGVISHVRSVRKSERGYNTWSIAVGHMVPTLPAAEPPVVEPPVAATIVAAIDFAVIAGSPRASSRVTLGWPQSSRELRGCFEQSALEARRAAEGEPSLTP